MIKKRHHYRHICSKNEKVLSSHVNRLREEDTWRRLTERSARFRKNMIQEYFEEYPILTTEIGITLVSSLHYVLLYLYLNKVEPASN